MTVLTLLFLGVFFGAAAQDAPAGAPKVSPKDTSGIEAKLVLIALKRPEYDAAYHLIRNSNHELSKARNSWLNLLSITLNYNQFDFTPQTGAAYVYPKYFFGLTIPVGFIFTRFSDIKIAKENQVIARDNQQELARTIAADVKTQYRTYLNYQSMLAVQINIVNDEQAVFLQVEKNFRDGKTGIDAYNTANKTYNSAILQQLQYKLLSDQTKVALEHDLGMTLEDALKH